MTKKQVRMNHVGPRLHSLLNEMRAVHKLMGSQLAEMLAVHERYEEEIELLAQEITKAYGWRYLAEDDKVDLPNEGDDEYSTQDLGADD